MLTCKYTSAFLWWLAWYFGHFLRPISGDADILRTRVFIWWWWLAGISDMSLYVKRWLVVLNLLIMLRIICIYIIDIVRWAKFLHNILFSPAPTETSAHTLSLSHTHSPALYSLSLSLTLCLALSLSLSLFSLSIALSLSRSRSLAPLSLTLSLLTIYIYISLSLSRFYLSFSLSLSLYISLSLFLSLSLSLSLSLPIYILSGHWTSQVLIVSRVIPENIGSGLLNHLS